MSSSNRRAAKAAAVEQEEQPDTAEQQAGQEVQQQETGAADGGAQQQAGAGASVPATVAQPTGGTSVQSGIDLQALAGEFAEDAGKGTSDLARDNVVPMVYVFQSGSPQVDRSRADAYIEGAMPGMFWLRGSPVEIVDGTVGFAFQPAHYVREIVEWQPRGSGGGGGGFVARWPLEGPDEDIADVAKRLKLTVVPSDDKRRPPKYFHGDNEMRETRYHTGYVLGGELGLEKFPQLVLPYVMPLTSTGHQVSKEWMGKQLQHTLGEMLTAMWEAQVRAGRASGPFVPPKGVDLNRAAPSWARRYRMLTRPRQNAFGRWSLVHVMDDLGWVNGLEAEVPNMAQYQRGKALYEAMMRGEKAMETPMEDADAGGGGAADSGAGTVDERAREAGI